MGMGLGPGEPPELWNIDSPDKVRTLHQQFVDAGADIILTNTFGCNRFRLKLHGAEERAVRDREAGGGDRRRRGRRSAPARRGRRVGRSDG